MIRQKGKIQIKSLIIILHNHYTISSFHAYFDKPILVPHMVVILEELTKGYTYYIIYE